jgi:hypothetical protein
MARFTATFYCKVKPSHSYKKHPLYLNTSRFPYPNIGIDWNYIFSVVVFQNIFLSYVQTSSVARMQLKLLPYLTWLHVTVPVQNQVKEMHMSLAMVRFFSADLKFCYKLREFWQTKNLGHRPSKFGMWQSDTKVILFHSVYFLLCINVQIHCNRYVDPGQCLVKNVPLT